MLENAMKLRLNLATAPPQQKRPFLAAAGLAGTLGLLALLLLSYAAFSSWRANRVLRGDINRLDDQIRLDRQKQQALESYFETPEARQVLDRSAFLNSLIDERSFPWTKIFMDLEQTLPPGVRVVSIAPRLNSGRAEVTLQIGAQSDESKIAFLKAIEQSKAFTGMVVTNEQHRDQPGEDKIVLDLSVWYATT
jgi:Tfp pilus assembly protein PilN